MSLIEAALRDQERRFTDLKPLDFAGEKPGKFRRQSQRPKADQADHLRIAANAKARAGA